MRTIKIENLKNIKELTFNIPENNGVYLLVGSNGAGKTSLLTCLDRIGNSYAFARGFTDTRMHKNIDTYKGAEISYIVNGKTMVVFRKKTSKWAPIKKGSVDKLNHFNFGETVFIKADSRRLDPKKDEVKPGDFNPVSMDMKDILVEIFDDRKFNRLQQLKISNGRGKSPTYFYIIPDKEKGAYYSEKRFSTGEIVIIRLIEDIRNARPNTLFLIDEAEMALHPRVQKNLYDYLHTIAEEKDLMVILSTHSTNLIKSVSKDKIILLSPNKDKSIKVVHPCYPARAVGYVDYETDNSFDAIYFVEDDMARLILKSLIKKYIEKNTNDVNNYDFLSYTIVPVGGYLETSLLAVKTNNQLFKNSRIFAVLDEDAFTVGISENARFNDVYEENKNIIKSLGFTPELWLIEKIEGSDLDLLNKIKINFHCEVTDILDDEKYKKAKHKNIRKEAKLKFDRVINIFASYSGENVESIKNTIVNLIIESISDGDISKTVAPLVKYI